MKKKILITIPNANVKSKISFWKLALKKNNYRIFPVYQWKKRIRPNFFEKVFEKLKIPIDISNFNKNIIQVAKLNADLSFIFIEKGWYIYPSTLKKIQNLSPLAKIIYFSNDNMILSHNNNFFINKIFKLRIFDKINLINIPDYKKFAKKYNSNIHFTDKAYSEKIHFKKFNYKQKYKYDISFIGSCTLDRVKLLTSLEREGFKINIWGYGWENYANQFKRKNTFKGGEVFNNRYRDIMASSRINLSFLRKINYDTQTSRSIEIPAAGGLILTEYSSTHKRIYGNLSKYILFSSRSDLINKIKFYLKNEKFRKKITEAVQNKIIKNIKSYEKKIDDILSFDNLDVNKKIFKNSKKIINFSNVFNNLLHLIKRFYYTRQFTSYDHCKQFCNKKFSNSYDNLILQKIRYNNFFETSDVEKLKSSSFFILRNIVRKIKKNKIKILELGGGYGSDYLNLKKNIRKNYDYNIIETSSVVKIAKEENLNFCKFSKFSKQFVNLNYDLIYTSSSLQYFKNPMQIIKILFKSSAKFIILANNNFSFNPKIFSQYSFFSQNLFTEEKYELQYDSFSNKTILYPNSQFSELKILQIAKETGYEVFRVFNGVESHGKNSYSKSIVFKKN